MSDIRLILERVQPRQPSRSYIHLVDIPEPYCTELRDWMRQQQHPFVRPYHPDDPDDMAVNEYYWKSWIDTLLKEPS